MKGLDTTPLYKMDMSRQSGAHFNRAMELQRMQQPNIPDPETTVGEGLMTGMGGAAAGTSIGAAMTSGGVAGSWAGPVGAGIGAGIGLLTAFG